MEEIPPLLQVSGMKMNRETIKSAMLTRMKELDMNVATLARKAGLNYDTPRDFLIRDKSGMPAADKLVAMLSVLNLTHLLVGGEPQEGNGLRAMRERRGLSIEALAARLPRSSAKELKKLETGGRLSFEWKARLAEALECAPDELEPATSPLAATTPAIAGLHETTPPWKSAAGTITEGDWTAEYDSFLPGVPHEFLGKLCVVKLENGQVLLRRVQAGSKPGHYLLEPITPGAKPLKDQLVVASALAGTLTQR